MTGVALPEVLRVKGGLRLRGRLRPPGDKSISHRGLLIGAMAEGTSQLTGLSAGEDVARTADAVRALGARLSASGGEVTVSGGRAAWHEPATALDCGNSGTTMRLLSGVLSTCPWRSVLTGDRSLSSRPMDRVADPLRAMGASVEGHGARCVPPLTIKGGALRGLDWAPEVASAQVKGAVLLAGLAAEGETVVRERVATRAHTEELLSLAGAHLEVGSEPGWAQVVRVRPSPLRPFALEVPADPSQGAFWVVAGSIVKDSEVEVAGLYHGPARLGFLEVLRRMGAHIEERRGQGTVDLVVRWAELQATEVEAAEVPSLDEVPVLAVAAAHAAGTTRFSGMGELRVKESDRLSAVASMVRALGAHSEVRGDDLYVTGVGPEGTFVAAEIDCGGDHRMAMAATVAALAAEGTSEVGGFSSVATSYPAFLDDLLCLQDLGAPRSAPRSPAGGRAAVVVAIDGPAGSGKSTVSKALAERLALARLDTGAMYRAVTWKVLQEGVDPADEEAVAALALRLRLEVGTRVIVDGVDVTEAIRAEDVSAAVSVVAALPALRRLLVERQRAWLAAHGGGVVEGRDIGTVVVPDASLKVYLTASVEERARRRAEEATEALRRRDHLDATRTASPMAAAPDAHLVDTTGRTVDEVVEEIASWL